MSSEINSDQIKIVAIGGSLRANSFTYHAVNVAVQEIAKLGINVEIIDLRTLNLPFCDGSKTYPGYPDVVKLQEIVKQADGIILATPEYHGGVSGVLKNALDLMSFNELEDKVFGLISVLGGEQNSNALNDMRVIVRWVHGWVIPEQIAVGKAWQAFNAQGQLQDENLRQRFTDFAQSLVANTLKLRGQKISQPAEQLVA